MEYLHDYLPRNWARGKRAKGSITPLTKEERATYRQVDTQVKVPCKQTSLKQPRNVPWQEPHEELALSVVAFVYRARPFDYLFAHDAADSSHTAVLEPKGDGT
jgi:hypothetical protein